MYAGFVKHISFPFYELRHGSNHYKELRKNMRSFERSRWFAPEQLKAIQWVRLKELLHQLQGRIIELLPTQKGRICQRTTVCHLPLDQRDQTVPGCSGNNRFL